MIAWLATVSCVHGRAPGAVHVVEPGETLSEIADEYGVPLESIVKSNHLSDPDHIFVTQKLVIPDPASEPTSADQEAEAEGKAEEDDRAIDEAVVKLEESGEEEVVPSSPDAAPAAFIWPVDGVVISLFGEDDGARHDGIDIAAREGTPIWAAADGEVLFAGEQKGYGLIVIVRHEGDLVTVYAHNVENKVKEAERVKQGQPVAKVGQTGKQLTPALHFEVRKGAVAVNPLTLLPK